MLLLPAVIWCRRRYSPASVRWVGAALLALGLYAVAAVVAHTLYSWIPESPEARTPFRFHRILFLVVTLGDNPVIQPTMVGIPMLELIGAGLFCLAFPGRHPARLRSPSVERPSA
jgi:hypothetical protein